MKIIKSFLTKNPIQRVLLTSKTKFVSIIIVLFIFININSCNGVTEPEIQPGRRDYVWKVDTLKLPHGEFITIFDIWGANSTDVWACGNASSNKYRLWHYDGNYWSNVDTALPLIDAIKIFGFDNKSVWLVTAAGHIFFYDGTKWFSQGNYSTEKEWLVLTGIWGRDAADLYAFGFLDKRDLSGYYGCILKYTSGSWRFINIEQLSLNFVTMGYDEESKKYFLSAFRSEDGMQFIYELYGNKLIKVYESKEETKIFTMNNRLYFMIGKKVYKYKNKDGLYIWNDFSSYKDYIICLNGRNEKDLFATNFFDLGHYDGKDYRILFSGNMWFNKALLFENEIFIPAKNNQTGINAIIHGVLSK